MAEPNEKRIQQSDNADKRNMREIHPPDCHTQPLSDPDGLEDT